jgi:hypothetical protein
MRIWLAWAQLNYRKSRRDVLDVECALTGAYREGRLL